MIISLPLVKGAGGILPSAFVVSTFMGLISKPLDKSSNYKSPKKGPVPTSSLTFIPGSGKMGPMTGILMPTLMDRSMARGKMDCSCYQ